MQKDNNQENAKEIHHGTEAFVERFKNMPKTKKLAMIGFSVVMVCVMIFIVFSSNKSPKPTKDKIKIPEVKVDTDSAIVGQISQNVYSQQEQNDSAIFDKVKTRVTELKPPAPPKLEVVEEPKPITQPLPIQPQQVTQPKLPLPISNVSNNVQNNQAKKQSTSIMAFGGGGGDDKTNSNDKQNNNSNFLGFDGGMIDNLTLQPSTAQSIVATKVNNDLKYTLLQGKIIDAVMETAINTQMSAGIIRAVVSRDVYGEHGDLILIPKGSRVVGSYAASSSSSSGSSQNGQVSTRVYAIWKRIITPSGVDINLPDTPSADPLGRSGIPGYLDTNLSNNLINAFLLSVLGPYIAIEASGVGKESTTTTANNNSSSNAGTGSQTTTTGSVGAQVLTKGLQDFESVAKAQIDTIYPPGVTTTFVDQGTKIDIIVQQDIVFPKQSIQLNQTNLP